MLTCDDGNLTQGYTPEGYLFTAEYDAENRLTSFEYTDSGGPEGLDAGNWQLVTGNWKLAL